MKKSDAIVFFVRDEQEESRVKPIPLITEHGSGVPLSGRSVYGRLNRTMIARIRTLQNVADLIVAGSGRVSVDSPTHLIEQRGECFADRITDVIEQTFALGYRRVVVIGNDCLTIERSDILNAFQLLERGHSIVGAPTPDGGSFLVGLNADRFDRAGFHALPWQTSHLFDALTSLNGSVALPVQREDIDNWFTRNAFARLRSFLQIDNQPRRLPALQTPFTIPSRLRKALTRSYLPSPPL